MENRDKKVRANFTTSGSLGVILRKNTKKNDENVTCRGDFEHPKRNKIFGVSLIHFQKTSKFHRYIRPITFQHSNLRCVFFWIFLTWNLGQNHFLKQMRQKYTHAENAILRKFMQKLAIFNWGNPMLFLQI